MTAAEANPQSVASLVPAPANRPGGFGGGDFDRYINVHAPATPQTKADVWEAVGK